MDVPPAARAAVAAERPSRLTRAMSSFALCGSPDGPRAAHRFWSCLESLSTGAGVMADWEWAAGPALPLVLPFLRAMAESARSHPCKARPVCACRHAVRAHGSGGTAICTCGDESACEPFEVEAAELVIHRLNFETLGESVRAALGFELPPGNGFAVTGLRQVGCHGPLLAPVYLSFAPAEGLARALGLMRLQRDGPFVLLTGTGRACTESIENCLRQAGGAHVALSSMLRAEGRLELTRTASLEPVLAGWVERAVRPRQDADYLRRLHEELAGLRRELSRRPIPAEDAPEPVSDEVARQVFALVKELGEGDRCRKAPILQVFRLYCLESLPAAQVARRCGCAKSLVVLRLGELRRKLGRDPAELRPMSAQFERIEGSLSDSRARSVFRRGAVEG